MLDLSKQISNFLNYCKYRKTLSDKTLKAYSIDLIQFCEHSNNSYCKESICNYIADLHKDFKPKTAKRKIASLKAFTHYLLIEDIIENNPFDKIETNFREPVLLPKTIPLNVIENILSAAYSDLRSASTEFSIKTATRNVAVLELLFATGARVSEICSLIPSAININTHSVKFYGKGSKERIIQIENKNVQSAINNYCSLFEDDINSSGYFFINKLHHRLTEQSVRTMINKYAILANCNMHITPHMFRHSFATLLLEEDVDIRYIQSFLVIVQLPQPKYILMWLWQNRKKSSQQNTHGTN